MIKVTATSQRNIRETTAPFEYTDEAGELKTEQIRVRYYSQTVAELKQLRSDALAKFNQANKKGAKIDESEFPWVSNQLAKRLESLPDIAGEDGETPMKITVENLDMIAAVNLRAIEKAIEDDLAPKSQPSS